MKKSELLAWLQDANRRWEGLLDQIGPARMDQPGVNGDWSMKDLVAHLTDWNRYLIARIQAAQRGESEAARPWPASLRTEEDVNAWIFEANHERPAGEVLADSRQVFEQLLSVIEALPADVPIEEDWRLITMNNQRFPAGEFFDHFRDDHEADVRAWLARLDSP